MPTGDQTENIAEKQALAAETVVSEDIFKNLHQQKRKIFDHSDIFTITNEQDSTQVRA